MNAFEWLFGQKASTETNADLDGGRYLADLYRKDSIQANFMQKIITAINKVGRAAGVSPVGEIAPPPPVSAINVKASGELLHVTLTHNAMNLRRGIQYFVEVDNSPNFPQPLVAHTGSSRSPVPFHLPTKDDNGNVQTYYVRAYAQYPGSKPSAPVAFGGNTSPQSITMGGTTQMTLLSSTGSGTASPKGQQGGFGLGKYPESSKPNPFAAGKVVSNVSSIVAPVVPGGPVTFDQVQPPVATMQVSQDNLPDGSTYVRVGNVNPDHTFHVSSSLNNQGSLVGSPAASLSYTSTTTSISWSWGAFTTYFPDGSTLAVSSGSQNFTGLTANTTYYFEFYVVKSTATMTCVMSDNTTAPASVQFLAQTVGADGHLIEVTDITAATPPSGTGGGSGSGGTCFSGDTRIKTDLGFVRMDELPAEFNIVNQTGIHHALRIVHTYRDDQLLVMPDNGLVTAGHMMQKGESWVPASELFSEKAPAGTRTLYDIQVVTGKPEDMHYILENGYVAHNKSRVSCFDGEARVLTTEGWIRFKNLPEKFQIVNSKGIFDGRLFQHQSSRTNPPRMQLLPDGGTVTDDHIVRPLGEADWRHAEELLPASTNFPEVVYNIISDGGYYRVGNLEARALEGND